MNFTSMLKGCTLWRLIRAVSKGSVLILIITLITHGEAQAALRLDQSRMVISAASGVGLIKVDNPTSHDYLIQSWISGENNAVQEALFVQPPLIKIKAHHKVTLHIEAIDANIAEQKQEKLYRLNIKEIPKIDNKEAGSKLLLVMLTKIKILYRPQAIPAEMGNAYQKLKWTRAGGQLQVVNPTPYYITFNKVWEGNNSAQPLEADTVAPFSTLLIKGYHGASQINYNIIDDYGDNSKTVHVAL